MQCTVIISKNFGSSRGAPAPPRPPLPPPLFGTSVQLHWTHWDYNTCNHLSRSSTLHSSQLISIPLKFYSLIIMVGEEMAFWTQESVVKNKAFSLPTPSTSKLTATISFECLSLIREISIGLTWLVAHKSWISVGGLMSYCYLCNQFQRQRMDWNSKSEFMGMLNNFI